MHHSPTDLPRSARRARRRDPSCDPAARSARAARRTPGVLRAGQHGSDGPGPVGSRRDGCGRHRLPRRSSTRRRPRPPRPRPPAPSSAPNGEGTGDSPVIMGVDGVPGPGADHHHRRPVVSGAVHRRSLGGGGALSSCSVLHHGAPTARRRRPPPLRQRPRPRPRPTRPTSAPPTTAAAAAPAATPVGAERRLLALVNEARAAENCAALRADGTLAACCPGTQRGHASTLDGDGLEPCGDLPGTAATVAQRPAATRPA